MTSNTDELEWIVRNRSDVQLVCLDIFRLINDPRLSRDDASNEATQFLIGIAFSLWRAVFLGHGKRTNDELIRDASKYLEKVIRHNTIAYGDDVSMRKWSFGYYLNNARFRLLEIGKILPEFHAALTSEEWGKCLSTSANTRQDVEIGCESCLHGTRVAVQMVAARLDFSN